MKTIKRVLLYATIILLSVLLLVLFLLRNPIRTLYSFKRIPNTQMFSMEFYGDYNIDKAFNNGVDVKNIEKSTLDLYFPKFLSKIIYEKIVPKNGIVNKIGECSTVFYKNKNGNILVGRNYDFENDALLIIKTKNRKHNKSVAVLNLKFLDLDVDKLKNIKLSNRFNLLLAPYVVNDGMNEFGLVLTEMSDFNSQLPLYEENKPDLFEPLFYRIILDYAKNVDEALTIVNKFNMHFPLNSSHFMLCDNSGKSIVVEYLNNKIVTVESNKNWQVSTNHILYGKNENQNDSICSRYKIASNYLDSIHSDVDFVKTFNLMSEIGNKTTMWTSIYNLSDGDYWISYRRDFTTIYKDKIELKDQ
jgi:hypothetical protein